MKIYVASKFENTKAVRDAHAALREDGHTITHDWTGENAEGLTGDARETYLRDCAEKDVNGVIFGEGILVLNHERMCGGFSEFGMAIAARMLGKSMCIVVLDGFDDSKPRNIFFHLPFIHHAKDLDHARSIFRGHQQFLNEKKELEDANG